MFILPHPAQSHVLRTFRECETESFNKIERNLQIFLLSVWYKDFYERSTKSIKSYAEYLWESVRRKVGGGDKEIVVCLSVTGRSKFSRAARDFLVARWLSYLVAILNRRNPNNRAHFSFPAARFTEFPRFCSRFRFVLLASSYLFPLAQFLPTQFNTFVLVIPDIENTNLFVSKWTKIFIVINQFFFNCETAAHVFYQQFVQIPFINYQKKKKFSHIRWLTLFVDLLIDECWSQPGRFEPRSYSL